MAGANGMTGLSASRVLVTGARGFVGRHLVTALRSALEPNARIFSAVREQDGVPAGEWLRFDLRDPRLMREALAIAQPDLVIHLAAEASVARSIGYAHATWATNVCGTLALAEAVRELAASATFLYVSSAEVYGATFNVKQPSEDAPLRPLTAYARSKMAAEELLRDVLPETAKLIVVRPSNHTGPGQDTRFVVPAFAAQIAAIERGELDLLHVGNLDSERDFMDVRDVVASYLAILRVANGLPDRSLFNVASGTPAKIGDLLQRLLAMSTFPVRVVVDPERLRPHDVPKAAPVATAVRRLTGWEPRCSTDDMLRSVLDDQRRFPDAHASSRRG